MVVLRFYFFLLVIVLFSACAVVPPPVATPPAPCADGQTSTAANPCTPDTDPPDTGGNPNNPGDPDNPGGNPAPAACEDTVVKPRTNPKLFSVDTSLKSCYAPGSSETVVKSVKLVDSTQVFVKPTFVFDIVRVNADGSTTSVAGDLLDGIPSSNPDIFRSELSKDQLLSGLKVAVAFKFKADAPKGKYVMVLSLFKDADAYNGSNLVGRIFYDLEVK
jgi:hypothetical protein